MLINLNCINHSLVNYYPYQYAIINNFIALDVVRNLVNNLPNNLFFKHVKRDEGSDKTYKVSNSILFSLEKQSSLDDLPEVWLKLVKNLTSIEYRQAISNLMDFDITQCFIEITLKKYQLNDYISPHTDRDLVPMTHVIFLNEYWEKEWGGDFCILESSETIVTEIIPVWDNSVVFRQSSNSWHAVKLCRSSTALRIGLQIAFWKDQVKFTLPGRYE